MTKYQEQLRACASGLYWDLVITRKLRDTALRERRFDDVNRYSKYIQVRERDAQLVLAQLEGT